MSENDYHPASPAENESSILHSLGMPVPVLPPALGSQAKEENSSRHGDFNKQISHHEESHFPGLENIELPHFLTPGPIQDEESAVAVEKPSSWKQDQEAQPKHDTYRQQDQQHLSTLEEERGTNSKHLPGQQALQCPFPMKESVNTDKTLRSKSLPPQQLLQSPLASVPVAGSFPEQATTRQSFSQPEASNMVPPQQQQAVYSSPVMPQQQPSFHPSHKLTFQPTFTGQGVVYEPPTAQYVEDLPCILHPLQCFCDHCHRMNGKKFSLKRKKLGKKTKHKIPHPSTSAATAALHPHPEAVSPLSLTAELPNSVGMRVVNNPLYV